MKCVPSTQRTPTFMSLELISISIKKVNKLSKVPKVKAMPESYWNNCKKSNASKTMNEFDVFIKLISISKLFNKQCKLYNLIYRPCVFPFQIDFLACEIIGVFEKLLPCIFILPFVGACFAFSCFIWRIPWGLALGWSF
jgi:hypothetical protein